MSSYRARRDRRRLSATVRALLKLHEREADALRAQCEERVAAAEEALARSRYEQPVRWETSKHVTYESAARTFPTIAMRMLSRRMFIAVADIHQDYRERYLREVERQVADEIARQLIKEDIVAMDRALVPMHLRDPERQGQRVEQFDFAVYVGTPVAKAETDNKPGMRAGVA